MLQGAANNSILIFCMKCSNWLTFTDKEKGFPKETLGFINQHIFNRSHFDVVARIATLGIPDSDGFYSPVHLSLESIKPFYDNGCNIAVYQFARCGEPVVVYHTQLVNSMMQCKTYLFQHPNNAIRNYLLGSYYSFDPMDRAVQVLDNPQCQLFHANVI